MVGDAAEAAKLEREPLVVLRPLEAFLDAHGLGSGPIEAEPIGDGHSNVTFLIRRGGDRWVLRRPPRGPFHPSTHDVIREFRFLRACAGSPVRVPEPLVACEDRGVIGAPFYVMAYVDGAVLGAELPPELDPAADPTRIADELVAALVEIHSLDWAAAGLGGSGPPPETYLERQVRRFSALWQQNRTRELPIVERIGDWLAAERPSSGPPTLVHGDFRLGNAIFARASPPRLLAVLDWEMATLGDPLADLGYMTATWARPDDQTSPLVRIGTVTAQPGFPDREYLARRYAAATGRDLEHLAWYQTLALWKGVVFLEGSYGRWLEGSTDDPFFGELGEGVPELAERAWETARAGGAR